MTYFITLFFCCVFWGYFDSLFNVAFKTFNFYKTDPMTTDDFSKTQMMIGISGLFKVAFWIFFFLLLLFKVDTYNVIVIFTGFVLGIMWANSKNLIEEVVLGDDKNKSFVKLFKYCTISYFSFIIYYFNT